MRSRFPAIALTVAVLVVLSSTASSSSQGLERGDVTCDGNVTLGDVSRLLRRAAGLETHIGCPTTSSGTVFYTYPAGGEVPQSQNLIVSVFADIPGSLGSWSIDVQFNPMVIQPVSCNPIGSTGCNTLSANTVRFAGAIGGVNGLRGAQHFGDIEFGVVGNIGATSPLQLTVGASDAEGQVVTPIVTSGSITVSSAASPGSSARADFWPPADVNCDDEISALDALRLTQVIALGQSMPLDCAVQ